MSGRWGAWGERGRGAGKEGGGGLGAGEGAMADLMRTRCGHDDVRPQRQPPKPQPPFNSSLARTGCVSRSTD